MQESKFHLKVVSREGIIFEGDVSSITSFNDAGKFDVLEQHANFISLINKGLTIRDLNGAMRELKLDNALMRVIANNCEVYIGVEGAGPNVLKSSEFAQEQGIK